MTAIEILTELRDSLPAGHPELAGIVRAIEVLRVDGPHYRQIGTAHESDSAWHAIVFRQRGSVPPLKKGIDYPVYVDIREY